MTLDLAHRCDACGRRIPALTEPVPGGVRIAPPVNWTTVTTRRGALHACSVACLDSLMPHIRDAAADAESLEGFTAATRAAP